MNEEELLQEYNKIVAESKTVHNGIDTVYLPKVKKLLDYWFATHPEQEDPRRND